eukprot:SAG31_NODE_3578_length_4103_cov_1.960789_8_plen_54_part_00
MSQNVSECLRMSQPAVCLDGELQLLVVAEQLDHAAHGRERRLLELQRAVPERN